MLLGKRPRPPMRRTTSMSELSGEFVPEHVEATDPQRDQEKHGGVLHCPHTEPPRERRREAGVTDWLQEAAKHPERMVPSPRGSGHRRNSGYFAAVETAPFLRACGLCKRRHGPGRDIFMYRGEAFCSSECRQQHMKQDELKDKCSLTSTKDTTPETSGSEKPGKGETVAAA